MDWKVYISDPKDEVWTFCFIGGLDRGDGVGGGWGSRWGEGNGDGICCDNRPSDGEGDGRGYGQDIQVQGCFAL